MNLLYIGILSFLAGVTIRLLFIFDTIFSFVLFTIAFLLFLVSKKKNIVDKKFIVAVSITFLFLGAGMLRVSMLGGDTFSLDSLLDTKTTLVGVVTTEVERKENYNRFVIEADNEKVLVYTRPFEPVFYGDELKLTGTLKKPEIFYDDRGDAFDWPQYLAKDDIYYEVFYPEVANQGKANLSLFQNFKRSLFIIKQSFIENVRRVVPEPEASLLVGEVVGEKSSLGDELEESLRRTGIIHVVVLSGYNVTIVADSIIKSLSFVPRVASLYLGIGGIVLFALMTGASATIVRASIMAILVILARRYGRLYDITTALLVAGFLMVLHNPNILLYDPSFQLSFLATLGLIYVSPVIEQKLSFLTQKFGFREIVGATIGTQIFVLPLLVHLVGDVSLVSLPVNLLILPIIPLTMLLGFITGMFGYFSYALSLVFGWASTLLLSYQLFIVEMFDVAYAAISGVALPLWLVLVLYGFLLAYFIRRSTM
ncbi:hypothetical protein CL654_00700 [bacterium]|nr:hypothetical protein [bacterium]|tara:strand:- start:4167 stop:5612 length:1446 start_codon:yes stop_codon:yes gene_type:complete